MRADDQYAGNPYRKAIVRNQGLESQGTPATAELDHPDAKSVDQF